MMLRNFNCFTSVNQPRALKYIFEIAKTCHSVFILYIRDVVNYHLDGILKCYPFRSTFLVSVVMIVFQEQGSSCFIYVDHVGTHHLADKYKPIFIVGLQIMDVIVI